MQLKSGEPAPLFECNDIFGKPWNLNAQRGKRTLISFFRYASCPFCNLRISQLIQNLPFFESKRLQIIAFFESPAERMRRQVTKHPFPFSVIADPERQIYQLYGVESSWLGFTAGILNVKKLLQAAGRGFLPGRMEGDVALLPADFLINEGLTIVRSFYARNITEHLPVEEIRSWLSEK